MDRTRSGLFRSLSVTPTGLVHGQTAIKVGFHCYSQSFKGFVQLFLTKVPPTKISLRQLRHWFIRVPHRAFQRQIKYSYISATILPVPSLTSMRSCDCRVHSKVRGSPAAYSQLLILHAVAPKSLAGLVLPSFLTISSGMRKRGVLTFGRSSARLRLPSFTESLLNAGYTDGHENFSPVMLADHHTTDTCTTGKLCLSSTICPPPPQSWGTLNPMTLPIHNHP